MNSTQQEVLAAPLVSIIIPCYNSEAWIGDAIDSALAQTYPHKEVIVIDDGSTDESLSVIRSYGNQIRWETGPNCGACVARNRGLAMARGDLVQFLDADDLLVPEKLARMVPLSHVQGSSYLTLCDWETVVLGDEQVSTQAVTYSLEDPVVCCSRSSLIISSPLHWRQTLIENGGFDEALPCAQERDLHLRLACHGLRFVRVPEVFVKVRRRAGSVSSDSIRVLLQHFRIVQRARVLLEDGGQVTDARLYALAGLLARDARILLRAGLRDEARRYFAEARRLHPRGGWSQAYPSGQRLVARLLGSEVFEQLVTFKRRHGSTRRRLMA